MDTIESIFVLLCTGSAPVQTIPRFESGCDHNFTLSLSFYESFRGGGCFSRFDSALALTLRLIALFLCEEYQTLALEEQSNLFTRFV